MSRSRPVLLDVAAIQGDAAKMRAVAEQLICPICGRGTYRALAVHTVAAHEVTSRELCDMLDVPFHVHFVADDLSDAQRERAIGMGLVEMRKPGPGRKPVRSKAGARILQEVRARNGRAFPVEHFRAMAEIANEAGGRKRAVETRRANLPDVTHGTDTSYGRGCRCDQCRDARNATQREQAARRRKTVRCEVCGVEFETSKYSTARRCRACPHNKVANPDHGTRSAYRRGCRCAECRAWRSDVSRAERAARKKPTPAPRTHCHRGHPYDDDNTYVDQKGKRYCRACRSKAARERRGT